MGRTKKFERAEVLDKAIQIFSKNGFAGTSLQDLEVATGVNKSGLYSEFKDKQDLFVACLRHSIQNSQASATLEQGSQGWQNIEQFLIQQSPRSVQKEVFLVSSLREIAILPVRARALLIEHTENLRRLLDLNLAASSADSPDVLADVVLTFYIGHCLTQTMESAEDQRDRVRVFLDLLHKPQRSPSAHSSSW